MSFNINHTRFINLVRACQEYMNPQLALDRKAAEEDAKLQKEHELELEFSDLADSATPTFQEYQFLKKVQVFQLLD